MIENKSKSISIRVSEELAQKIKEKADEEYTTPSQWIRKLIIIELKKEGK